MKLKTLWITWLLLFLILFIPLDFSFAFEKLEKDELIIDVQSCGCPCPNASIIKGTLQIPDSLTTKLKPNFIEANIIGADPYNDYAYYLCSFKIKGQIVGATPEECDANGCYYTPIINVESYVVGEYISWFWKWNKTFALGYLFFLLLFLIFNITFGIVRTYKRIKHKRSIKT